MNSLIVMPFLRFMDRPAGRVVSGPRNAQILASQVGSGYAFSWSGRVAKFGPA